ncbi:glycosyl hydrolase [Intrasporangium oryzae NRRL B-24470]|uniref:Glycosyl hydrolase n=1 Tax=Intrasporangium oryzae NRRL B-24470 TaxID=1386089 RepID=W9GBG6_9MICO|nr:glycosyl hydrolase [Intrasporangium oryzae]EWT03420.1 glycosyl hydrolase [Intrasporangium oryzae NRRL B-24470]
MSMSMVHRRGRLVGAAAVVALAAAWGGYAAVEHEDEPPVSERLVEKLKPVEGNPGDESHEAATASEQYAAARTAPGIVGPGAYTAAWASLQALPTTTGTWTEETTKPYNSDDPNYREYYHSNSSGGAGLVTGRVTGLATLPGRGTGGKDVVFAGGADGGVFRSLDGGSTWTPITSSLPTLSTGDLEIAPDGALWYATGEANTGATSYVGTGVYRLADPMTSTSWVRVGGTELEGTSINKVRFDSQGRVYAATFRGIWRHTATATSGGWEMVYAPNPDYLPGGSKAGSADAAYKNVVNDVLPKGSSVMASVAWRGGDTYNGFYLSAQNGDAGTWAKVNPAGALRDVGIGNAELAISADGSHLYTIVESTTRYANTANTVLDGVYDSPSGSITGPWNKIADSQKLAASGSALKLYQGYRPGVQAWYNNFVTVDPADSKHVFVGLEEVFETRDAGVHWTTVAPYWNFSFPCWSWDDALNTCTKPAPHSDQHAVSVAGNTVYIGNDGGIYARSMDAGYDEYGHGKGWKELNPGLDALQYYSVGVGTDASGNRVISGGLQDNGQSLFVSGQSTMVSPFGGDGGITLVDPRAGKGCNIVAEYVNLAMAVTNNCGRSKGDPNETPRAIRDIAPSDPSPRFIAPFDDDATNADHWIAGGRYVWTQTQGYAIQDASAWSNVFDNGSGHSTTALAMQNGVGWTAWCGPCNNQGFARGVSTNFGGTWHQLALPADLPNRYVSGVTIDPSDATGGTAYLALNGFSRKFTEGPGAGYGHLWKTTNGGASWTQVGATTLPDVPADSLVITKTGGLVLGTDLGVLYSGDGGATWKRLGANFPATTVMQVLLGADGKVYAATHGRGIWSIPVPTT